MIGAVPRGSFKCCEHKFSESKFQTSSFLIDFTVSLAFIHRGSISNLGSIFTQNILEGSPDFTSTYMPEHSQCVAKNVKSTG
jgi:hypothetical protein